MGHREETMQVLWVKRRVETVRRFLMAIKTYVKPPDRRSLLSLWIFQPLCAHLFVAEDLLPNLNLCSFSLRNLRPPSMILVARTDDPFSLPIPRSRFVQDEMLHSLQNLRLSPFDVVLVDELDSHG